MHKGMVKEKKLKKMFQEHVNQEQISDLLNDKNTHMRNGMTMQ